LIIAGCSKNHDDSTTETEVPTTVQATFINPNVRKASIAREEAAITIQKALRKHQAVQKIKQKKDEAAREEAERKAREKEEAAIIIQKALRKHHAVQNLKQAKEKATKIQALVRGKLTREALAKQKEEAARAEAERAAIEKEEREAREKKEAAETTIQKEERDNNLRIEKKTNGNASGPKEIPKGNSTSYTSDLSDGKDDTSSIEGDHTKTTDAPFDAKTKEDPNSEEGQRAIRDKALSPLNSNPEDLATLNNATPDQAGKIGRQVLTKEVPKKGYREKKEGYREKKDETEDEEDSFSIVDSINLPNNVTEGNDASTKIEPTALLASAALRQYITKKLPDFKAAKDTFEVGGVNRPVSFYKEKEDVHPKERKYIALAHDKEENNPEAQTSGERSLSIVLKDIKTHLESKTGNNEASIKILIPLQQIRKKHWTLLEIDLSNQSATHYDSKGICSASFLKDQSTSKIKQRIKEWVKEVFPNVGEVDFKYDNTQGLCDNHNCGRYTLIKLHSLLNPEAKILSLDDINKSLNGEAQTNIHAAINKPKEKSLFGVNTVFKRVFERTPNSQDNESSTLSGESLASEDWIIE
jgi:hypothetical protein